MSSSFLELFIYQIVGDKKYSITFRKSSKTSKYKRSSQRSPLRRSKVESSRQFHQQHLSSSYMYVEKAAETKNFARKMLMKLTAGVNFINVKRARVFRTYIVLAAFLRT
jgi:hypothetical protein